MSLCSAYTDLIDDTVNMVTAAKFSTFELLMTELGHKPSCLFYTKPYAMQETVDTYSE